MPDTKAGSAYVMLNSGQIIYVFSRLHECFVSSCAFIGAACTHKLDSWEDRKLAQKMLNKYSVMCNRYLY